MPTLDNMLIQLKLSVDEACYESLNILTHLKDTAAAFLKVQPPEEDSSRERATMDWGACISFETL